MAGAQVKTHKLNRITFVDVIFYIILGLVALSCLIPFIHLFSKSISEEAFVIANKVFLIPKGFTLDAYKKIFADSSILRSMYVQVVITVAFTAIGMFLTISAAYALSRKELKGRKVMTFLIMKNNFSAGISDSLVESATIDGANHFTILARIVIPLSKPIIATIALFYAVGRWNAYQDALYYIKQRTDLRPLQLKLYYLVVAATESFQAEANTTQALTNPEVLKAACVIFATVPIVIVYPFLQKYFVQGTMVGAVKE